eukprot:1152864-Pelagomonas_calceolata.AAC.3
MAQQHLLLACTPALFAGQTAGPRPIHFVLPPAPHALLACAPLCMLYSCCYGRPACAGGVGGGAAAFVVVVDGGGVDGGGVGRYPGDDAGSSPLGKGAARPS